MPAVAGLPAGSGGGANGGSGSGGGSGGGGGNGGVQGAAGAAVIMLIVLVLLRLARRAAASPSGAPISRRCRPAQVTFLPDRSVPSASGPAASGADPLWKESDTTLRMWTKSACVVLAWGSILVIVVVAAGMSQPGHPAQANIRIASSTTEVTGVSVVSVAAVFVTATRPAAGYVVQPGDTLSGIAAALTVRGGWPALYAANRSRIGPDPDVIRPGTALVVPGRVSLARYTVAAGDTLAAIAAALAVRGGWPALYAANQRVIGPDPGVIRPGTVLAIPRLAAPRAPVPGPGRRLYPAPPSAPAGSGHRPPPLRTGAPDGRRHAAVAEDDAAGGRPGHRGRVPRRTGAADPPPAQAGRHPGGNPARSRPRASARATPGPRPRDRAPRSAPRGRSGSSWRTMTGSS